MKSTRLFRNFILLFSLLGLGSLAWGDRYETVFVSTEDTARMTNTEARNYLKSSACLSSKSLVLQDGEIAYVFGSGAQTRPNATSEFTGGIKDAYVSAIFIDKANLDSNNSISTWDPNTTSWPDNGNPISNLSSGTIIGPANIKVFIKPWSSRTTTKSGYTAGTQHWEGSYYNSNYKYTVSDWDFKASEGFITFRIVGSEQAPSKKFATVIPENATTNVRVILEQSTDLINWSSANPGVFPPSTSKRFFRVRSVEE